MPHRRTATAVIAVFSTIASVASAMPAHGAKSAQHHPAGIYVAREGLASRGNEPAAFVADGNGGEHLVTIVRSQRDPAKGRIVYLTRKSGAQRWTRHPVPGLRPLAHGATVEAHLSFDGRRVFAVVYQCDGVFVTDAPLNAARLPEPTLALAGDYCGPNDVDPYAKLRSPQLAIPIHRYRVDARADEIGIVLADVTSGGGNDGYRLYLGNATTNPTGSFDATMRVLPRGSTLVPQQIALDPGSTRMAVVSTGVVGSTHGIYVTRGRNTFVPWSAPTQIASLHRASIDYTVDSLVYNNRRIWIGLQRPSALVTGHSLYLVHSTPAGQWLGAIALTHSGPHDVGVKLAANPLTGNLHASFTRTSGRHSGIVAEMQPAAGGWTKPAPFSTSRTDRAISLYVTPHGRNVIAYRHA